MNIQSYIQKSLAELGLSSGESNIYFEILMSKNVDASYLKGKTGYSTAGVYKIINLLVDKEFVVAEKRGREMCFKAVPLNTVAGRFSLKGRRMDRTADKLKELSRLSRLDKDTNVVEGNDLTDCYLSLSRKIEDFIFCIGSFEAVMNFFGPEIEGDFIRTRVKRGKTASALIFDNSNFSQDLKGRDIKEKRETKILPNAGYPLEFSYIFDDEFVTIYRDHENKIKMLKIDSPEIARSQMVQFQTIWNSISTKE